MTTIAQTAMQLTATLTSAVLALTIVSGTPSDAAAGETEAKALVNVRPYGQSKVGLVRLRHQSRGSHKEHQKLLLASSGTMNMARPDKIRATRFGGFANVEITFDGKTLTLFSKDSNLYAQFEVPGSIDNLIEELRSPTRTGR
ncbi:Predicted protein [Rhizobium tibeticum]|uniref:Uncharacterized protein n=1 Tax=Rhizobium tibeticum TaxID=501024 RepID=A0A1H8VCQ5_9HYPH|nr:hypothetical protein RTCCBAU85039_5984 [Rhizobium tibeticum]SEP13053.1 Predicted protein [Rhizobium tibeticum]